MKIMNSLLLDIAEQLRQNSKVQEGLKDYLIIYIKNELLLHNL